MKKYFIVYLICLISLPVFAQNSQKGNPFASQIIKSLQAENKSLTNDQKEKIESLGEEFFQEFKVAVKSSEKEQQAKISKEERGALYSQYARALRVAVHFKVIELEGMEKFESSLKESNMPDLFYSSVLDAFEENKVEFSTSQKKMLKSSAALYAKNYQIDSWVHNLKTIGKASFPKNDDVFKDHLKKFRAFAFTEILTEKQQSVLKSSK